MCTWHAFPICSVFDIVDIVSKGFSERGRADLSEVVISFLLGVCPEERLLGHTVVLFLICLGPLTPFCTVAVPVYVPTKCPLISTSPPKLSLPFFLKSWIQIDYDSVSINYEYCMNHIFPCSFIKARLNLNLWRITLDIFIFYYTQMS